MKATLEVINQMQADGVIGKYAIGGAVGATFYLEPAATVDVDIFATLPVAASAVLVSLAPIYEYLRAKGCAEKDEHIVIGAGPFSFFHRATISRARPLRTRFEPPLRTRLRGLCKQSIWLLSRSAPDG